jgi:protein pelota
MIDTHPDKAYYGYSHVAKANEELAIDVLLVTDELFRSSDLVTRKKYVQLVESVRENGGKVYIFSALHVTGVQLNQLSGIAAILRYPLPDLNQLELDAAMYDAEENESSDSDESDEETEDPEKRLHEDIKDMGLF